MPGVECPRCYNFLPLAAIDTLPNAFEIECPTCGHVKTYAKSEITSEPPAKS